VFCVFCIENVQGIPEFWLTIFKNVPILQDMVQEHDEPILQKLLDIRLVFSKPDEPMVSFTRRDTNVEWQATDSSSNRCGIK